MAKKTQDIIRIALIGPESTAKSTLCEQLAKQFDTVWVREYAREYLSKLDRRYELNDVLTIAKKQLEEEQLKLKEAKRVIFVDTELIVAKVWCEDVFNTCPSWISEHILSQQYDLYLLTYPDLPWEADPLRENPHRRNFFFAWYERELKKINAHYATVKGNGDIRFMNANKIVKTFIAKTKN